jgi:hypothetical protein
MYRLKNRNSKFTQLKNRARLEILLIIPHNLVGRIQQRFNQEIGRIRKFKTQLMKLKLMVMRFHRKECQNYYNFYLHSRLNLNKDVKLEFKSIKLRK